VAKPNKSRLLGWGELERAGWRHATIIMIIDYLLGAHDQSQQLALPLRLSFEFRA